MEADAAAIRAWVRRGTTSIDPCFDGMRLDRFLASRFTYRSRSKWAEIIREGRIRVNGNAVRPSKLLRAGDVVSYVPLEIEEPPVDGRYEVLYEDAWMVAIAKSGNLPIHPSGRYFKNTLLHILFEEHPEWGMLHVVHRLDRETSGVVVFGRTREATRLLAAQFASRRARKEYLVLVHGIPSQDGLEIDLPLGLDPTSRIRKAVGVVEGGVPARTLVEVLHRGEDWALCLARPLTGRLHQIRVHLKAVGHPVIGDKVYGLDEGFFLRFISEEGLTEEDRRRLILPRQGLHAWRLSLKHPAHEREMQLRAPLPEDIADFLRKKGVDPHAWV